MNTSTDLQGSPEYIYAEAERTHQLVEELGKLKVRPRQMWPEAVATMLALVALQKLLEHIPLTIMDRLLVFVGFMAPMGAIAARLYKSEKRVEVLIQLLTKSGRLGS